jgi:DNA-binding CsgD family transcriptional regulator
MMSHLTVAFYIAVELAGFWIVVLAFLYYRRGRNPAYFYFGLFFSSSMLMLLCEIAVAYWEVNGIAAASWAVSVPPLVYGVAQLLHFFAVFRLAFTLLRLRMSPLVTRLHLALLVTYAAVIAILLFRRSDFEPQHIALGFIQVVSMALLIRFRRRLIPADLRRVVMQFVGIGLFFAPMIGISVYTDLVRYLPFGRMAFQVFYAVVAEILLTYYTVKLLFTPPAIAAAVPAGGQARIFCLSEREAEIAKLVGNGYTNREIAEILKITPHTVRNHLYHIYQKLGVRNRVELLNDIEITR